MDLFLIWASLAALAVNLGCVAYNIRQMTRYYRALEQVYALRTLQLELCSITWRLRHNPAAMQTVRNEIMRQITEPN